VNSRRLSHRFRQLTNSLILVDDQKRQAAPLEVITNGEPGLPASDHQRPNMM
jgi:hypothetical protein